MLRVAGAAVACLALTGSTAGEPPLRVDSAVPQWLAPGGRLVVRGWAGRGERISLRVDGRPVAATLAGRVGGFRLAARLGREGVHSLALAGEGRLRTLRSIRVRPLTIAAAGDVRFGDAVAGVVDAYGPEYPWASVGPLLREADIATANLEGAVSTRGSAVPGKPFTFRGPPSALDGAARTGGIDVFHWGIELDRFPGARQQELAAASLNAGAQVVLGAHPHVLQPMARPAARRLVAWSLGNFVFPPHSPGTDRTGVLTLRLDASGVRGYSFTNAVIVGVQPRVT